MKLDDAQLRTIQRRSQAAALLSLLVFLAAIGYSYYHLRSLQRRSAQLEQEIATQERHLTAVKGELASAQDKLNTREQEFYRLVQAANRSEEKLASINPSLLIPKARAVAVQGDTDNVGRQIYDFYCWLQVPEEEKQKIAQVRYEFDHPTFRNKVQSSSDAEHNYQVSYRGWGALRLVTINVDLKNGSHIPIYFDMYQALNDRVPDKELSEKIPQK